MKVELAKKLAVTEAVPAYSRAISLEGSNAGLVEATVFYWSATGGITPKLRVRLQHSNDLQNWTDETEFVDFGDKGYAIVQSEDIAAQYVRVKYEWIGNPTPPSAATAIVAAGVDVAEL